MDGGTNGRDLGVDSWGPPMLDNHLSWGPNANVDTYPTFFGGARLTLLLGVDSFSIIFNPSCFSKNGSVSSGF